MKWPDRFTVVFLLGCAAMLFGVWQIHRPSAWIIGGLLLIFGAVLGTAAKLPARDKTQ